MAARTILGASESSLDLSAVEGADVLSVLLSHGTVLTGSDAVGLWISRTGNSSQHWKHVLVTREVLHLSS